jgi:hypothetical protein
MNAQPKRRSHLIIGGETVKFAIKAGQTADVLDVRQHLSRA